MISDHTVVSFRGVHEAEILTQISALNLGPGIGSLMAANVTTRPPRKSPYPYTSVYRSYSQVGLNITRWRPTNQ